jgi:hypothetical protein
MSKSLEKSDGSGNLSDAVTVLTVGKGKSATKSFRWNGREHIKTHGFDAGKWFCHEAHAVSGIHELSELLTAVEASQDSFIIRGELSKDVPSRDRVRRMKNPDDKGVIWFTEQARHWLCIDIDDVPLPAWADPVADPERIAKFLIDLLPECFQGVACHWQMSSSAGVKPATEARAHLWFWLDRPIGQAELKRWKDDFDVKIDPMVFGTVQPLYVARPIFVDKPDPLPRRSGLLEGDRDVVTVPEIDMSDPARTFTAGTGLRLEAAAGFESKLALLGDGDGLEGFHAPITSGIAAYVSEHGDSFDEEALKEDIRKRIDAAPKSQGRTADIKRYKSDAYLDPSIDGAIDRFGAPKTVPATYPTPSGGLDDARAELSDAMRAWHDDAIAHKSAMQSRETRMKNSKSTSRRQRKNFALFKPAPLLPIHGIEAGTGIGKSREMRLTVRELIQHLDPGHCIFVAVPNHRLAEETADAFKELGVQAAVYRGLSADDPEEPGDKMCRIAPDAEALRRGGGSLRKLCDGCPHSCDCGWQRQRKLEAQVWIGTHNLLFHPRMKPIPPIDFVVIDESPIAVGLDGFSYTDMLSVSVAELRHRAETGDQTISSARHELADHVEQAPVGVPLYAEDFRILARLEFGKITKSIYGENEDVPLHGGMTAKERRTAIEIAKRNRQRLVEVAIWEALGGAAGCGQFAGLRIEEHSNHDGVPERRLRLRRRRKVHSDFGSPTLLLDATPQWDVYRQFWDISCVTKIEAASPHVGVLQIIWSASKAKLLADTDTASNNRGRVRRHIESRASKFQRVLVLCQMGLEEWLSERLPENVKIGHFNAIRGLDLWKDVDCLILIGRTQPPPAEMEMQAEVIFGEVRCSLGVGVFVCIALEAYMAYAIARRIGLKLDRPSDIWKYFGLLAGILGTVLWGFRQLLGLAFSAFSIIPGISPLVPAEFFVTCLVGVLFWTGFEEAKANGSFKIPMRLLKTAGKRTTELFRYQWSALSAALSPSNLRQMGLRLRSWLLGEIHEEAEEPRLRGEIFCAVAMAALLQRREDALNGPLGGLFLQSIRDRYSGLENADTSEIASFMRDRYDEDQIGGVINLIKGKLFERVVEAHENADGDEWTAHLHDDESYPGSDIVFTDTVTGETIEVSLKATDSAAYIEHSLMRYPDIPIFATSEVGEELSEIDFVTATEFSNIDLTTITEDNFQELLDKLAPLDTADALTYTAAGVGASAVAVLWPFVIAYLRGRIDQEQLRKACIRLLPKLGPDVATKLCFSTALGPVYAWYVLARLSMKLTPANNKAKRRCLTGRQRRTA